jgi:hypothetical protein
MGIPFFSEKISEKHLPQLYVVADDELNGLKTTGNGQAVCAAAYPKKGAASGVIYQECLWTRDLDISPLVSGERS